MDALPNIIRIRYLFEVLQNRLGLGLPKYCLRLFSYDTLLLKNERVMSLKTYVFDPTVLRAYDIRGIVGKTITTDTAYAIGRSLGTLIQRDGGKQAAVGWDGRHSSPEMAQAVSEGLADAGINVKKIGLGPTPMLYYAVFEHDLGGGIMITGSHNPPDYNGFKMMLGKTAIYGETINQFANLSNGHWESGQAEIEDIDLKTAYCQRILQGYQADKNKDLTIAWDVGNGAVGAVLKDVLVGLPGTHHVLFGDVDGNFPNHHPDPAVEHNLSDLRHIVDEKKCDFGVAFDGDGDRIGIIDRTGHILWGDQLLQILASDILQKYPGAPIIADVKASQTLFDRITDLGGQAVMSKTGHSLVKARMKELHSPLAGEMSGHIFYADQYYGYDDAIYVAIRLIDILVRSDRDLSQLRSEMKQSYSTSEIRLDCSDERKFQVIEEVASQLHAQQADLNDIDGVRVQEVEGWWLLRASNTQPALVARAESNSQEGVHQLLAKLRSVISAYDIEVP